MFVTRELTKVVDFCQNHLCDFHLRRNPAKTALHWSPSSFKDVSCKHFLEGRRFLEHLTSSLLYYFYEIKSPPNFRNSHWNFCNLSIFLKRLPLFLKIRQNVHVTGVLRVCFKVEFGLLRVFHAMV
jgi:hypothetical protein